MEVIAQMDPNIMKCTNKDCGTLIFFQPSAPDYKQKDETGKVISKHAADHMAQFRVRCGQCTINFCTKCLRSPYHVGMTCEEAESNQNANKCRFCNVEIKKSYNSPDPAFREVCGKDECVELIPKSCNKILACGHYCRGFAGETEHLHCLEDGCIDQLKGVQGNQLIDG